MLPANLSYRKRVPARQSNKNLSSRAESRDLLFLYTATNVGASAVGRGTRNNLSSRAQSRGPCVPQSHPSQAAGCPIFPRSVRKGGNRESRPAHAVILRKRSRAHATPNEGSLHQAPPISAGASVPARADPKNWAGGVFVGGMAVAGPPLSRFSSIRTFRYRFSNSGVRCHLPGAVPGVSGPVSRRKSDIPRRRKYWDHALRRLCLPEICDFVPLE